MKTLLFLGGSPSQIAVLKRAKELGHTIVLCDYLPDNPGQKLADHFYAVSTTDLNAVLSVANAHHIDGVVAYASDPAANTAAEIAKMLSLPGSDPTAVKMLTHKNLYREYLTQQGFNTPRHGERLDIPFVVKPVDCSGSKGITVVRTENEFEPAVEKAKSFSRSGQIIREEYIERKGYQIAGDGFMVGGKLKFRCFANEHFDRGGIVPVGESFPSVLPEKTQSLIHDEVQRFIDSVSRTYGNVEGAVNFDIVLDKNDRIFLMEIGARAGGCLIPEVIKYATGVDETEYVIRAALGQHCSDLEMTPVNGFWSSYMVHSTQDGIYDTLWLSDDVKPNIIHCEMFVKAGERVKKYDHSGCTIGMMILKYDSQNEMLGKMDNMLDHVKVRVGQEKVA